MYSPLRPAGNFLRERQRCCRARNTFRTCLQADVSQRCVRLSQIFRNGAQFLLLKQRSREIQRFPCNGEIVLFLGFSFSLSISLGLFLIVLVSLEAELRGFRCDSCKTAIKINLIDHPHPTHLSPLVPLLRVHPRPFQGRPSACKRPRTMLYRMPTTTERAAVRVRHGVLA